MTTQQSGEWLPEGISGIDDFILTEEKQPGQWNPFSWSWTQQLVTNRDSQWRNHIKQLTQRAAEGKEGEE